jgi:hypothetical protein
MLIFPSLSIHYNNINKSYGNQKWLLASLCTADEQNNGNTTQYRNITVLAVCAERTLVVFSLLFSLFTLCSASVNALEFVFSNCWYKITAKWETCQITNPTSTVELQLLKADY